MLRKIAKSCYYLRHVCLFIPMEQFGSNSTVFYEIWKPSIFRKSVSKIQVSLKSEKNKRVGGGTLNDDVCTTTILLRMRNVSYTSCKENQNTHFVYSNYFFLKIKARILCSVTFLKSKHILCSVTFFKTKTHFVFSKFFWKSKHILCSVTFFWKSKLLCSVTFLNQNTFCVQ